MTSSNHYQIVIHSNYKIFTGDSIHLIVGNHNHVFSAVGGIWILGGVGSVGDTALDSRAITGQVSYRIKQY